MNDATQTTDTTPKAPVIVSFGGGVDSTAILVEMARRGEHPDLILFADVGAEAPETYAHIERFSDWLESQGMPRVTVVSRPKNIRMRASTPYTTITGNCVANETLPSEAFGRGACSMKWKHEPMEAFLKGRRGQPGWLERNGWKPEHGKPVRVIGYDATESCSGKRGKWAKVTEDDHWAYRYPLVTWGWTRERCIEEIEKAGVPAPPKSACTFCPNQQPEELYALALNHPKLFLEALAIEANAKIGKHGLTRLEGLWRKTRKRDNRSGSWVIWARDNGLLEAAEEHTGERLMNVVKRMRADVGLEMPGLTPEHMTMTFFGQQVRIAV